MYIFFVIVKKNSFENRRLILEALKECGVVNFKHINGGSPVVKTDGQKICEVGPVARITKAITEKLEEKYYRGDESNGRD